jgi:flagellar biosynthesis protein FlhF
MERARQELGGDALLIHARPATPETRYLGEYEVVFGVGGEAPPSAPPRSGAPPAVERLSEEVAELKRQIARLTMSLNGSAPPAGGAPAPQPASLDSELAARLVQGAPLEELFATDPSLGRPGAARAVVALVGPPGAGKTTTLVKLAANYGLAARKSAHILTADVHRIAAVDQLRALAAILGIGCDVAETPRALEQLLREHASKEIVFIDTPGLAAAEMEDGAELAALLASDPEMDTHLVLAASMQPEALSRTADRYRMFAPRKLIFTRLDETWDYGALVNLPARLGLPLSFLCGGQEIPGDLEEASARRLLERMGAAGDPAPPSRLGAAA